MAGPLEGIRVVEMAGIGPTPSCVMMLADMGADVIRVDRPPSGPKGTFDEMKRNVTDRGRRSVALDMKLPGAADAVLRLIEGADALVEGFRPGVMERLGLGPDACLARNPRLVYGRLTGWGQTGPLAPLAGHDINYIAISGALYAMGHADRPPIPPLHLVGDMGAGAMMLAFGLVCGLLEAKRSGIGQVVDAAICDGAASLTTVYHGLLSQRQWSNRRESNMLDGGAPFYRCYETADAKYIAIGPIESQFYKILLERCQIDDPMFAEQWNVACWPEMREKLAQLFRTRTRSEWCKLLEGIDACFAPVLDFAEAPSHPHNKARGTFVEIDGVLQPAPAPRFSRTPGEAGSAAIAIGQHSEEVLLQAGFTAADVARLTADGTVYAPASTA